MRGGGWGGYLAVAFISDAGDGYLLATHPSNHDHPASSVGMYKLLSACVCVCVCVCTSEQPIHNQYIN